MVLYGILCKQHHLFIGMDGDLMFHLPWDIKKGIRKHPSVTFCLSMCRLGASKGRAPHTRTYSTTPRLWVQARRRAQVSTRTHGPRPPNPRSSGYGPVELRLCLQSESSSQGGCKRTHGAAASGMVPHPDVQRRPLVLPAFEHLRSRVRGTSTPRAQGFPLAEEVPKTKVYMQEQRDR